MKILLLSPHTDDAELGCGGSITRFIDEDHEIFWVVFSIAKESLPKGFPEDAHKQEFMNVVNDLKLSSNQYKIFDFRVRNLNKHRQRVLEELVQIKRDLEPDLVIGPSINDYHQDHQVVANEMIRAYKKTASIISYELPWNHVTFNTQLFVRLEEKHIAKKFSLLQHYKTQLVQNKKYFKREFIFGLSSVRGTQCGNGYAEAFEVVRWMVG